MKYTIISFLLLGCITITKSQNWYEGAKTYEFSSLSTLNPDTTIILKVIYDNNGTASITRSERKSENGDRTQVYVFGAEYEMHSSDSNTSQVQIDFNNKDDYWFIQFDNYLVGKQNESKMNGTIGGVLFIKSNKIILN